jgi:hypothetical protein
VPAGHKAPSPYIGSAKHGAVHGAKSHQRHPAVHRERPDDIDRVAESPERIDHAKRDPIL